MANIRWAYKNFIPLATAMKESQWPTPNDVNDTHDENLETYYDPESSSSSSSSFSSSSSSSSLSSSSSSSLST